MRSARPASRTRRVASACCCARDRRGGHAAAALAREVHREAAPAGADLEHVVVRPDARGVGERAVLGLLRLGERRLRRLEERAGVGHRVVQPEREERVAEVVVRVHVALGAAQPARQLDARDEPPEPREHRERRPAEDLLLVAREQRDEARAGRARTTRRPGSPRRPRAARSARAARRSAGRAPRMTTGHRIRIAEAAGAVGRAQLERSVLDARRARARARAARPRRRDPAPCAARATPLSLDAAHVGIDPRSGSNGGLRWNGTRLRQSCSACQWMRAMTWPVTHG